MNLVLLKFFIKLSILLNLAKPKKGSFRHLKIHCDKVHPSCIVSTYIYITDIEDIICICPYNTVFYTSMFALL